MKGIHLIDRFDWRLVPFGDLDGEFVSPQTTIPADPKYLVDLMTDLKEENPPQRPSMLRTLNKLEDIQVSIHEGIVEQKLFLDLYSFYNKSKMSYTYLKIMIPQQVL